jgi:hypothetical protein
VINCSGVASLLCPTFIVYYKETTTTRNINFFYKKNILWNSVWTGLLFVALALHLNIQPKTEAEWSGKGNFLKRNKLLSCDDGENRTAFEFSMSANDDFK